MIASQASETVMLFVDRLFLSRHGTLAIAASMSGGISAFVLTSFFAGIVGYTNAVVAQYYGAGRRDRCVESVVQAIFLSLLFFPIVLALIPLVDNLYALMGHSAEQIELEYAYFRILILGAIFILLRQVLVGFFLGIGESRTVMLANLAGMLVNIPLNYLLIFGKLGFPALGIRGAAIGTVCGTGTILLILLLRFLAHRYYREYPGRGRWKLRAGEMRRLLHFGLPAGAELFLNVFAFNLFIQLMHGMGPDVATAVTITFNYDMVAFVPMLGLGIAVTSLVGRQMGGGNPEGARQATLLALRVGYSYAAVMMLLFVFGAEALVALFAGGFGPEERELVELAEAMLRLAAIYTLADITQLVFSGALRGAGDTRFVMIISVIIHWLLAVGTWLLIRVIEAPPLSIWIFFIGFVIILGAAIYLRFRAGHWRELKVIEEEIIIHEVHQPEVKTEAEWM
jgi:MATE family multidrug resistance protein